MITSISKKLKDSFIQGLEENVIYSNPDLKEVIRAQTGMTYGKEYQESHFAGSLTALRKKGILEQVERGQYRKRPQPTSTCPTSAPPAVSTPSLRSPAPGTDDRIPLDRAKQAILSSIRAESEQLQKIAERIYLDFAITDEDYQSVQKIRELIQHLQNFTF